MASLAITLPPYSPSSPPSHCHPSLPLPILPSLAIVLMLRVVSTCARGTSTNQTTLSTTLPPSSPSSPPSHYHPSLPLPMLPSLMLPVVSTCTRRTSTNQTVMRIVWYVTTTITQNCVAACEAYHLALLRHIWHCLGMYLTMQQTYPMIYHMYFKIRDTLQYVDLTYKCISNLFK